MLLPKSQTLVIWISGAPSGFHFWIMSEHDVATGCKLVEGIGRADGNRGENNKEEKRGVGGKRKSRRGGGEEEEKKKEEKEDRNISFNFCCQ
jgi:hypothetical protein